MAEPYECQQIVDDLRRRRPWKRRSVSKIVRVVVHRCDINVASKGRMGNDPYSCSAWFAGPDMRWPGHPYHFDVDPMGKVWQTNDLDRLCWGAKFWNAGALHIRVEGDFRVVPCPPVQRAAVAMLCCDLLGNLGLGPSAVVGHSELSPHGYKRCPGDAFEVQELRKLVLMSMAGSVAGVPWRPRHEAWWR